MKWDMEMDEIEVILEKIWNLHDKLSDAIHSVSRTHFLNSIKTLRNSHQNNNNNPTADDNRGFVLVKDFRLGDDDSAVREAKSLNAIRTALENLEDQLEFYHTLQIQQHAERDAAIAQLEQSRIILAMRLAEHSGNKYEVIEEALAFVGDVHDAGCLVSPENLYGQPSCYAGSFLTDKRKRSNILINVLFSSFSFMKRSLRLEYVGGIVGNAALVAVSMIALLHLHQVTYKEHPFRHEISVHCDRSVRRSNQPEFSSSSVPSNLDVLLARG